MLWKAHNGPWQGPVALTDPHVTPLGAPVTATYQAVDEHLEVFYIGTGNRVWALWKDRTGPVRAEDFRRVH